MPSELLIRRAQPEDAPRLAEIHLAARRAAPMPASVHPDDDVRRWLGERVATDEVWVADDGGRLVGYARSTPGWLDDLYVDPEVGRRGVGSVLLDTVKGVHPDGFSLWVFQRNTPAREFYRRRGLIELEHTDGHANEEREPDLRMVWPGSEPLRFLRSLVDAVDDELGALLERRAALSRVIQELKHVGGHQGRDPEREREIAERLAHAAPSLPIEGLVRVVDAVITVGLDSRESSPRDVPGGSVGSGWDDHVG
jgi:chorismate mutase/GNAT superfamily N-acetyltransferase